MKRKSKAPVFAISIDDTEKTGVNLISFVSRPAIEADFVALSAKEVKLATDGQKQILTGPVLIPEKSIFRMDPETEEPFYIQFAATTIEQIRNKFHKNNFTQATNDEHELLLDGNYVVESWIIADAEKDKAVALGLTDLPAGTWMVSYHVPDADYWEKEILSGNKRGFSLEGFFNYEEVKEQLSKIDMPQNPKGWHARLKADAWKMKLSTIELEDGTTVVHDPITNKLYSDDNSFLPSGSYKTKQGQTFKVETSTSVYQWWYPEEQKLSKTNMSKNTKKPGLIARLMAKMSAALALATMTLEDGSSIEVDDETKEVFKLNEEGERGDAVADGTYTLEDGSTIEVVEGKLKEAATEPSAEEELASARTTIADLQKQLDDLKAANLSAEQKTSDLEAKLATEKEAVTKLSTEKQELETKLSKKPGAAPVKLGGDKSTDNLTPAQARLQQLRAQAKK